MANKLLVQFILLLTAVVIIVTYVRPSFTDIASVQDDIVRYESTVSKAAELNAALTDLIRAEQSITSREIAALDQYVPAEIEEVTIMRDIQNIFNLNNIAITSLTSAAAENFRARSARTEAQADDRANAAPSLVFRDFQVAFNGTYEELKLVLQGLEVNAYPLEIMDLTFAAPTATAGENVAAELPPGAMSYALTLRAYALPSAQ